jgi:hypothetical protein
MAKRARGSVRPGQRRPIDRRPATTPAASPTSTPARAAGLTDAETARAAELEQQLLASERQAEAARSRARERSAREPSSGGGPLAVRAAQEYAYVARDMKQIGEMAVLMLAILFGLWFLIDIAKVISIA